MMTDQVAVPSRMEGLPRDHRGYIVPWFVAFIDGKPDFRVIREGGIGIAYKRKLCWLCGQPRGVHSAFVIGPMCAINRTISEPPSHRECAVYAAKVCPFLSRPKMHRQVHNMPEDIQAAAGYGIKRNPGVALVWVTRSFKPFRVSDGVLFEIGDPEETLWFCESRAATRAEVMESIETGLPLLRAECDKDPRPGAHAALDRYIARAMPILPAA